MTRRMKRRGATLVETALVIGAALFLMFGIYEYGRFVMFRQLVDNAAREGARTAVASSSVDTPAVQTQKVRDAIDAFMAGQQLENFDVQVYKADNNGVNIGDWTDAPFGQNIMVQVTGNYRAVLPTLGILPDPLPITARVMMRSEAN